MSKEQKLPQEIKDKEYEYKEMYKILEKHLKDDFYKTGQYHNKISDSMHEYGSIVSAGKESRIKELEEALKKILDDNNNYSDIKLIASQALNKHKNQ